MSEEQEFFAEHEFRFEHVKTAEELMERTVISTMLSSCCFLVRRGLMPLAQEMRDEFLRSYEVRPDRWDAEVDRFVSYLRHKPDLHSLNEANAALSVRVEEG